MKKTGRMIYVVSIVQIIRPGALTTLIDQKLLKIFFCFFVMYLYS